MKKVTKILTAVICICLLSLSAASCKASAKTNQPAKPGLAIGAPSQSGGSSDDSTIKDPATPANPSPDKPDTDTSVSPPENTDGETSKLVIDKNVNTLIIEGLKDCYTLNAGNTYLCIAETNLKVYLNGETEKGGEVPTKNYTFELRNGDIKLNSNERLTADGEYELICTLIGAVYEDGTSADPKSIRAGIKFNIVNPIIDLRLTSGITEQTVSKTDKMSASWAFEIEYANGSVESVSAANVKIPQLDTQTAGNHVTTVAVNGYESKVLYTINSLPSAVHDFKISLKDCVDTETENGKITFSLNDFNFLVTADSQYRPTISTSFMEDGKELESLTVYASDEPVSVTVKAVFEYVVDDETVTQVMYNTVQIHITQKSDTIPEEPLPTDPSPEDPNEPLPEKNYNLTVNSETVSSLTPVIESEVSLAQNGKGEIILAPQEGIAVTADEVIRITNDYSVTDCYTALYIDLIEYATVKIAASTKSFAAIGIITPDGEQVYEMVFIDYELTEITFALSGGNYSFYITGGDVSVYSIEVNFG